MEIKVLGSGCAGCRRLYEEVQKAIQELGWDNKVEYVTDISVSLSYGVMSAPALVINNKVVSQGQILKAKDIKKLLSTTETHTHKLPSMLNTCSCDCDSGGN